MPPLGSTPTPAIMNVFFIPLINGAGPLPFSRVISLWLDGSTWSPPSRLERSDVLVRQKKSNNEDAPCREVQTWSALLSGAQRQGLTLFRP